MAGVLTPARHLLARARELLGEELLFEGVSDQARQDADSMAVCMWRGETVDVFLREIREVLPPDAYRKLLAFCNREYPVLFASLPASVTTLQQCISGHANSSDTTGTAGRSDASTSSMHIFRSRYCAYNIHMLDEAATRASGTER